jgi:hypothetical protein
MSVVRQEDEDEEAWAERRAGLLAKMQKKVITLTHAVLQVCPSLLHDVHTDMEAAGVRGRCSATGKEKVCVF